jgi:hypothetical protein
LIPSNKNPNTIEDKLHIPELRQEFQAVDSFSTADILSFYSKYGPEVPRTTINWRVYQLVNQGVLQRIGRGLFKIGKGVAYFPEISRTEIRINNYIKKELPFLDYCIWNFNSIKEFSQHIPNVDLIIVEVERSATESLFYLLREKYKRVFHKSERDWHNAYSHGLDKTILIRPLVTEAPVQQVGKITSTTLEKLLVDVFCDDDFDFLQGSELVSIFKNAFQSYTINQSKMQRYASRKQKKEALLDFVKSL